MSQVCQNVPYNIPVVFTQRVPSVGVSVTTEFIPARIGTTTVVSCVPVVPDNASTTTGGGGQPPRCVMTSIENFVSIPGAERTVEVPFTITVDRPTTTISTSYSNSCYWVPVAGPTTTNPPPWTPPPTTAPPTFTQPTFTPPTPAETSTAPPVTSAPVFRPNSAATGTTSGNSTTTLGSGTGGGTSKVITSGSGKRKGKKKLPTGGMAGIAISAAVLAILLLYTGYVWLRNRRKKDDDEDQPEKQRAAADGGDVEELESARDTMMTRSTPYSAVPTQSPDDVAAVRRAKADAYGPMTSATTLETQPFFGRASTATDSIYSSDRGSVQPGAGVPVSAFYGSNFAGDWDPYQALQAERVGQARKIEEEQRLRGPVVQNPDALDGGFRDMGTTQGMHGGGPVPMGSTALYAHSIPSIPQAAPFAEGSPGVGHLAAPSPQYRQMGAASPGPPPIYPGTPEI